MSENQEKILENDIYKFLTADLTERYKVSVPSVYSRLKALNINPLKEGKTSYITAEQLKLMDELHAHLEAGGKVADFVAAHIESSEIVSEATPANTEAIVLVEEQTATVTVSTEEQGNALEEVTFMAPPEEALEHLEAQKEIRITSSDLQEANERGQYRAAAKIIAEETMVRVFEATEGFTIPGLKEQVEQHRQKCRKSRPSQKIANNLNDFLSQTLQAAGVSGLMASPSFRKNQSPTSSNASANA